MFLGHWSKVPNRKNNHKPNSDQCPITHIHSGNQSPFTPRIPGMPAPASWLTVVLMRLPNCAGAGWQGLGPSGPSTGASGGSPGASPRFSPGASWGPAMQTTPQSSSASSKGSAWCLVSCFATQCNTPATRLLPALPSHLPFQPKNWAGTAEPRSTPEPQPEPERPAAPLSPDHDFSRFRWPHCARFGNLGILVYLVLMSS